MKITAYKTHKITNDDQDLHRILEKYLPKIEENSIIAVTSKIISICEGRVILVEGVDKEELIIKESEFYLPKSSSKYNLALTVTNNLLVATAGIDESNGNGYYILWPEDVQKSANQIRSFIVNYFGVKNVGVIITDSRTTPLRWGVTGAAIAHSGFRALNDYSGKMDLFGREFKFEKLNVADSLAAAAVAVMGEGSEQTPLAVIEDVSFVEFQQRDPLKEELDFLKISIDEDLYAPFLQSAKWLKGGRDETKN